MGNERHNVSIKITEIDVSLLKKKQMNNASQ